MRPRRRGRRIGSAGRSQETILAAARALFARRGFRGTTMRAVARRAHVDLALVHYFFGSKSSLFEAAIELPESQADVRSLLAGDPAGMGERFARYYLERVFAQQNERIMAILRAALGDPESVPLLRKRIERDIVATVAGGLPGAGADLATELAGALIVGLFLCRDVVAVEPLASASMGELVPRVAAGLAALLRPAWGPRHPGDSR